jgi:hypothetical protein
VLEEEQDGVVRLQILKEVKLLEKEEAEEVVVTLGELEVLEVEEQEESVKITNSPVEEVRVLQEGMAEELMKQEMAGHLT